MTNPFTVVTAAARQLPPAKSDSCWLELADTKKI